MLSTGFKKYVSNPIVGLIPFLLYIILHVAYIPEWWAISIALVVSLANELCLRRFFKSRIFCVTSYVVSISLLATLIFCILDKPSPEWEHICVIFCEICIVCLFIVVRVSKTFIATRFLRNRSSSQKALLHEFYLSAAFIQYSFTIHLFAILLYTYFKVEYKVYIVGDFIVFTLVPLLVVAALFVYEIVKLNNLSAQLRKEEWLPIITESGEVTGKVARSVSEKMKNKFMHPVVRIALVSDGKIFLQERRENDILNPRKLDYPFEKYILFKHDINLAVRNVIFKMMGYNIDIPVKFLMKYTFENEDAKRLVFLFVATADDDDIIKRTSKITGKFWTIKQIEEAFGDEIFGECFELEFEYIKNMVLLPTIPKDGNTDNNPSSDAS